MLQAVLFDLDGTLIDTAPDFYRVLNQMREEDQMPLLDFSMVRNTVSDGARALINLAYGLDEGDEGFQEKRQRLLDLYLNNIAIDSRLFDGLDEMIFWLTECGLPMAIVTNKPRLYSEALLEQLILGNKPLDSYTASLVCPDDVTHKKPHPEPLLLACQEMGVEARNCIYVGDHIRDIEAGQAAGMTTIAAKFGYIRDPDAVYSWKADQIAHSGKELYQMLKAEFTLQSISKAN